MPRYTDQEKLLATLARTTRKEFRTAMAEAEKLGTVNEDFATVGNTLDRCKITKEAFWQVAKTWVFQDFPFLENEKNNDGEDEAAIRSPEVAEIWIRRAIQSGEKPPSQATQGQIEQVNRSEWFLAFHPVMQLKGILGGVRWFKAAIAWKRWEAFLGKNPKTADEQWAIFRDGYPRPEPMSEQEYQKILYGPPPPYAPKEIVPKRKQKQMRRKGKRKHLTLGDVSEDRKIVTVPTVSRSGQIGDGSNK